VTNEAANGGPRPPSDLNPRRDPALDFQDRDLADMTPADYDAIGFLCGLEVHQQLATKSKLFCRCPAGRHATRVDAEVLRHMRPTLSEMGVYDGCALMEFKTKKEIVYLLERGTVCTYEIDDTPPFEIDPEAVSIAVEIATLLGLNLVSELHVMRKQYLDGSIPTGFQRTTMVGLGGEIPFRVPELGVDRPLRIRQLSLEEDSSREVSDVGHRIVFRADRLGTPLSETVTEPELLTPYEAQAAGRLIARVARATGKVRRGPGAARQDVNVSVAGGRRVEIKGVPHHKRLPLLVHIEAFRQLNLLRIAAELKRRGLTHDMLALPDEGVPWAVSPLSANVRGSLRRCDFPPLRAAIERGDTVAAVRLPLFGGLLRKRTQPGITFAREMSERVRVIACLTDRPFLLHSDLRDFGLSPAEWRQVQGALRAKSDDAVVVVWGPTADVATAVREIAARASEALDGIPAETRQAHFDGTTGFERILPGAERMYPDTDTPPVRIAEALVADIRRRLPERPWETDARYRALGLDDATAARLGAASVRRLFDEVGPKPGVSARRLAHALVDRLVHLRRTHGYEGPAPERLRALVQAVEAGRVRAEAFERAFDAIVLAPRGDAEAILARFVADGSEEREVARLVSAAVENARPFLHKARATVERFILGQTLPTLLGRVDPAAVRKRMQADLDEVLAQGPA